MAEIWAIRNRADNIINRELDRAAVSLCALAKTEKRIVSPEPWARLRNRRNQVTNCSDG